jgi:hypothetical protein
MNVSRLRTVAALGITVAFLSACSDLASMLNIFLVRFFYAGGGVGSLIVPSELRDASTVYSNPTSASGLAAASRLLSANIPTTKDGLLTHFADKSKYGLNLSFGLGADNSGNSDSAAFPAKAGLSLFVQEKLEANKTTTELKPFGVSAGAVDTIPVVIPVPLSVLPDASFQSMLRGDSIPYFLTGRLGFDLKAPTGDVISSHETDMDIATSKIATRPSDSSVDAFLDVVSGYVGK